MPSRRVPAHISTHFKFKWQISEQLRSSRREIWCTQYNSLEEAYWACSVRDPLGGSLCTGVCILSGCQYFPVNYHSSTPFSSWPWLIYLFPISINLPIDDLLSHYDFEPMNTLISILKVQCQGMQCVKPIRYMFFVVVRTFDMRSTLLTHF